MRRLILCAMFMVPALLVLTTTPGCSKKDADKKVAKKGGGDGDKKGDGEEETKTALNAKLDSTITGKVTYDGDPPVPKFLEDISKHKDKETCLKGKENGETVDPTWRVDKKGGVANVVIWLEPPAGKYFNLADADKKRTDVIVMDQPHCAFVPHVVALFPKYFDGKELVKSGQIFELKNSAPFDHNSKWSADGVTNKSFNQTITKGDNRKFPSPAVGQLNPQDEPLEVGCTIHTWMRGYIWIFDNPYHAVTKDDGSFAIKNVPTGVELTVVGWHEGKQKFFTEKKTFTTGDNTLNLKIKK